MRDFRKLSVWRKAHAAALLVYHETSRFPAVERYALTAQVRRLAVSVAANIAEGCGRGSDPDRARFFQMAAGSASELEYQLLLARDLGLVTEDVFQRLSGEAVSIRRMLSGLLRAMKNGGGRRAKRPKRRRRPRPS